LCNAENDAGGSKLYVLRSLVPTNWKRKFVADESQNPSRHLLVILLMLIKCQGDKLSEGSVQDISIMVFAIHMCMHDSSAGVLSVRISA